MLKKKVNIVVSCAIAGIMSATFSSPQIAFAQEIAQTAQTSSNSASTGEKKAIEAKQRVSVHDPSIVKAGDEYYVFGSNIEAAKSSDLQNWTKFSNGYTTPDNVIFGDLSKNLAGSFAWAGEDDSDCKGGFSVWAPCVVWNGNYVNNDGTTGAYMMYYCTSSTYKRSCIGYAVSKNIEGPYTYVNTIIYSGFTKGDAHDANSKINTNYENTNIKALIDDGTISGINSEWFAASGEYNTSYAPNAIDPEVFWDNEGKMWMNYGSWSGGTYLLQLDPATGKPIYPGDKNENSDSLNITDRYFGTRIGGGYTKSGEGGEIVYDKETGYYYLYTSYAGLAANGGYNIRMFRSKNPDGPYLDSAGNNAALPGNVDNSDYGIKLIGNYKFACQDVGYKAAGHNSSFIDDDGQMYLVYHQRFNDGTETHEVRTHQMFINEDGWPCVAPYENSGDKISENGYAKDDIVGNYQFINHGKASSSAMLDTLSIKLNDDYTITGDVTGTWSMKDGTYYMDAVIDGVTYKGVFFKQQDESLYDNKVMTFSAVGDNNECIWGSRLELNDENSVNYAADTLAKEIPSLTRKNINLKTTGAYDTSIRWQTSDKAALTSSGQVTRGSSDKDVTLTATISKGNASVTKTFKVTVEGKLDEFTLEPIYKYNFETTGAEVSISSVGSKDGDASLIGTASIDKDDDRGNVLNITNEKGAIRKNYLKLPSDTFSGITDKGYTVGMWVNVDKDDPNYFEHSALFEANDGGAYPVTRISANLFGRINANDAFADATEISKPLDSNTWQYVTFTVNKDGIVVYVDGEEVSRADKDVSKCFENDFLSKMKDVAVGSGNIWGDADIGSAKFDNVAFFDTALTSKEVEALYNDEAKLSDKSEEKDDSISLNANIDKSWDNNVKETVKVTNNTDDTIHDWTLKFKYDGNINQIWNAEIASHDNGEYVIKNSGWPQDLKSGETVEFGFLASYDGDGIPEITDYSMDSHDEDVDDNKYNVDFQKDGEWNGGFNGNITISNKSDSVMNDWTLEFDYADSIDSIWNAKIVSHEGNHYLIKPESNNSNINSNESVKFGFAGTPSNGTISSEVPENFKFTQTKH